MSDPTKPPIKGARLRHPIGGPRPQNLPDLDPAIEALKSLVRKAQDAQAAIDKLTKEFRNAQRRSKPTPPARRNRNSPRPDANLPPSRRS